MYIYRIKNIKPSTCTLLEAAAIDMPTHLKIKSKHRLSKKAIMMKTNKYLMEHYGESIDFEDFSQINEANDFDPGVTMVEDDDEPETKPIKNYGDVDTDSIIGNRKKDRKKYGITGTAPTSYGSLADEIKKYVDDGRFQMTDADTYEAVSEILRSYAVDKDLNKAKAALEDLFGGDITTFDFNTDDVEGADDTFDLGFNTGIDDDDDSFDTGKGTSVNSFGVNEDDDF